MPSGTERKQGLLEGMTWGRVVGRVHPKHPLSYCLGRAQTVCTYHGQSSSSLLYRLIAYLGKFVIIEISLLWTECLCCPIPKFIWWNLTPNVMLLGRGAFGRCLGHENGAPMNEINALMKEISPSSLAPSTMWGHVVPSVNQKAGSQEALNLLAPWSRDFPNSRTVSNTFLLLVSHSVYVILLQHLEQTKTLVLQVALLEKGASGANGWFSLSCCWENSELLNQLSASLPKRGKMNP